MRLRLTARAVRNLSDIAAHLGAANPYGAARVGTAIQDTMAVAAEFPGAGRPQEEPGVRKLVARRYPYLVYYSVDEAAREVVILAVRHAARSRLYRDA